MSVLFGGGGKRASQPVSKPQFTGLNVQSSAFGLPITLFWGKGRVAPNLIWAPASAPAFRTIPHTTVTETSGGKGGGGSSSSSSTTFTYTQALLMALTNTELAAVPTLFKSKSATTPSELGFTLFQGTDTQIPFGYITTNYPAEARNYHDVSYLANDALDLGSDANLPMFSAVVQQVFSGVSVPGVDDVNLADVIPDFLCNTRYGLGIDISRLGDLEACRAYWTAQDLLFSPALVTQEKTSDVLNRWAQLSNSWFYYDGGLLRFVPLGTETVTAHGVTYTPDLDPAYDLTTKDFLLDKGSDLPVKVDISDPADAVNHQQLSILDSSNDYNAATVEWKDDGLISDYGAVTGSALDAKEISNKSTGAIVVRLIGKRGAYIRRTYSFRLGWQFIRLLPGSIVTLTEPNIPLNRQLVRIKSVDEDDKGRLALVAEELPTGIGQATLYVPQAVSNVPLDFLVDPGDVNAPAIFEPSTSLTGGVPQVWIGLSGGPEWGGADVWLSFDAGVTFNKQSASITNPCRQGETTADFPSHADPDTLNTLSVDLTESQGFLPASVTHADADAFRSLCILGSGASAEYVAYGDSTVTGTNAFDLTYIRRGVYGSLIADHPSTTAFCRIDDTIGQFNLPPAYAGATLYFKFPSFNRFGQKLQDLAAATTYTFTTAGVSVAPPAAPTGLGVVGGTLQNTVSWSANSSGDAVDFYKVYQALGPAGSFASATLIRTLNALTWTDTGLLAATTYTYFIVAHNAAGDGPPSAGVDGTTDP